MAARARSNPVPIVLNKRNVFRPENVIFTTFVIGIGFSGSRRRRWARQFTFVSASAISVPDGNGAARVVFVHLIGFCGRFL